MKLNFWQWLGVVLLVIWAFLYFRRPPAEKAVAPTQPPTLPATLPSTTPSAP